MFHIFISARAGAVRPGATGQPVPGYEARVVDDQLREVPPNTPGLLAVRGPTGCRYWRKPERQAAYVRDGWNLPGDIYLEDADGYFWYQCRNDDLIISGGYNIAGPEVEAVLIEHPAVVEAAVVASPDALRGFIPKAFVTLKAGIAPSEALVAELQEHVRRELAPYKYPREIEFVEELPKTETGKIRRVELREREKQRKGG
jgi:2-aminobenzoate-CoA ligase